MIKNTIMHLDILHMNILSTLNPPMYGIRRPRAGGAFYINILNIASGPKANAFLTGFHIQF